MRIYISLALWLLIFTAQSQGTINSMNFKIPDSDSSVLNYSLVTDAAQLDGFNFAKSGTNCDWDFSGFESNSEDSIYFVKNKPGLFPEPFSNAGFKLYRKLEWGEEYYTVGDSGLWEIGEVRTQRTPFNYLLPYLYDNPKLVIPFPCSTGTSYNTNYSYHTKYKHQFSNDSFDQVYYRRDSVQIIATGKLKIPSGTYEVLLEFRNILFIDSIYYKSDTSSTWELVLSDEMANNSYYNFISPLLITPIVHVSGHIEDSNGLRTLAVQYYNGKSLNTSLGEIGEMNEANLFPIPCQEILNVTNSSNYSFKIINSLGQSIQTGVILDDKIDVSNLPNGSYSLIVNTKNSMLTRRIIKIK